MYTRIACFASLLISMVLAGSVSGLSTVPTEPFPASSPLIVTAYATSGGQTALDFVQIYNNDDTVRSLDGWRVAYTTTQSGDRVVLADLAGYMLPESHYVLAVSGGLVGQGVQSFAALSLPLGAKLKSLVLLPPSTGTSPSEQPIATTDGIYRRNLTTTGYSTSTTFAKQDPAAFTALAADPLYQLPGVPSLRIVEILPRAADCAPNDHSAVCGDYVKLQNTSDQVIDASNYRLRTDSGTSESGNAFGLDWLVEPEAYITVSLRSDGGKMSLTDSGGYVWLEDVFGLVKFYDETMVQYPSASSSTKQGWSWALAPDDTWQWTSTPQPNQPNLMTVPPAGLTTVESTECPAGKYRNPETGRCKNIEDAIATLAACDEDQERNPLTNRCRKLATTAAATLAPCDEGQERNPATNRCRSVLAATAQELQACPEGQERNPATNRCRAVTAAAGAPPALTEAVAATSGLSPYWLGAAVLLGAAGYGAYEWRSDIAKATRRLMSKAKTE